MNVNVTLPADVRKRAYEEGINLSRLLRVAVEKELAKIDAEHRRRLCAERESKLVRGGWK